MSDAGAAPAAGGQGGAPAAGGTAAPAAGTTAATTTTGATQTGGSTDWAASFSDNDLKSYAQNKGWKDPSEAVNSYRQLEKLHGVPAERLLKLPDKPDAPEWADINLKLGVPKDAKEYQFDVPKEYGDDKFADTAKDWFHKAGVPKSRAEAIVKNWNEYVGQKITAEKAAYQAEQVKQADGLKKEWGAAYDQNLQMAKRAAQAFGFEEPVIDKLQQSMGFASVMKLMHSLQTKIGEDSFVGGSQNNNSFGGVMTPGQAQAQIALRKKDVDFASRLGKKDSAAMEEWTTLHKMAFPDQY